MIIYLMYFIFELPGSSTSNLSPLLKEKHCTGLENYIGIYIIIYLLSFYSGLGQVHRLSTWVQVQVH